tara:strand:- start:150 stop:314 length:165 start_codon:yes stop_codon:yes gene_type:complete
LELTYNPVNKYQLVLHLVVDDKGVSVLPPDTPVKFIQGDAQFSPDINARLHVHG